ncbi:ATP-binding cassette domain-containing protein [Terrabacter sp. NPDC080008]|uniref:ATP-binding cassette domain-containing protein n=1 Tax=Terrabacter sp. NPDC080008 TaxID=3155176 RepID=UPI003450C761
MRLRRGRGGVAPNQPAGPSPVDDSTEGGEARTALAAYGLGVRFGEVVALDDVTLEVAPGELVAVSGPSGAGKSTLLSSLAGALDPAAGVTGRVVVAGSPVRPCDAREATVALGVSVVPQGNGLATVLTATENVLVPLLEAGVRAPEAIERTREALAAVGLEDSGDHLVEELSGGQQQRVAVARALAARPRILLADEPTSELDHANRELVLALLSELAAQGAAVVMATHDLEAAAGATRHVVLDEGRATSEA